MHPKYEEDRNSWIVNNIALLKEKKFKEVDVEHLIEELDMANKSDKRELSSRLGVLIGHLLKLQFQPDYEVKKSWISTILRERFELIDLLEESPSLKSQIVERFPKAYKRALAIIEKETPIDLKVLPKECPYTLEQCLDEEFYPE